MSNAVADIASLWGRGGAADPGRYGQALKQASFLFLVGIVPLAAGVVASPDPS